MKIEELQLKSRLKHVTLEDWDFDAEPIYWTDKSTQYVSFNIEAEMKFLRFMEMYRNCKDYE